MDILRLHNGGYDYSIRTSGEAVGVIIREIIVIYVSVFFIGAKIQLFFNQRLNFFCKNKILTKRNVFVYKTKKYVL